MTLTNLLVSLGLSVTVLGAVITSHLFGLRLFERGRIKLDTTADDSHKFYQLSTDLKDAKLVQVGQGSLTAFTPAAVNSAQRGNALQVYSTTDTNQYVRYFLDTAAKTLKRRGLDGQVVVLAGCVSNALPFQVEDAFGHVLSNTANRAVVKVDLLFSAFDGSGDKIGAGRTFSGYRVQSKFALRPPD